MKTYPLAVTLNAILRGEHILLIKRNKPPYQGYWTMPGGKIEYGEHIDDSAVRECQEETGITPQFECVAGISNEVIQEHGQNKHHFILFVCQLRTEQEQVVASEEGELQWFALDDLPERMPAADKHMLKEYIIKKNNIVINKLKTRQDGNEYYVEEFT